jgi:hypothetical protein
MNGMSPSQVTHIIISSVVPPVEGTLRQVCEDYFHTQPLFVEPGIKTGMPVLVDNPAELGADRLVNAIAAFERYGGPCIVVDFGTATTFDVISAKGEYLGGAIAPGLGLSADALFSRAARLSRVDIKRPAKVIGTNTVTHLQSGLYFGYIGLVDGILERIIAELGAEAARHRHRRPGAADRRGLALHRRDRRYAHPRWPADSLRAQPHAASQRLSALRRRAELLQLLHRDRRALPAAARGAAAALDAGLGADRDLARGGHSAGGGAARHRRGLRQI